MKTYIILYRAIFSRDWDWFKTYTSSPDQAMQKFKTEMRKESIMYSDDSVNLFEATQIAVPK